MLSFSIRTGLVWALSSTALLCGCEAGGVGDPCVPEVEYARDFPGFDVREANVESNSFSCETRLCLVNHFQGRVSCPYGQDEKDLRSDPSAPERCRTAGANPEAVTVPVEAWDLDRTPERTVYCSCRCDGPDPGARYCDCPDGYQCTPLVPAVGRREGLAGSYCVRKGTAYQPSELFGPTCDTTPEADACTAAGVGNP
jgi:hypothetical protein